MFHPDHLSFSGTLQRSDGRVMILRRNVTPSAPLPWEHSFSGSPRPAELLTAAVRRRLECDLGILAVSDEKPHLGHEHAIHWIDPVERGNAARNRPERFSPLRAAHAQYLPFFGGNPHTIDAALPQRERAIG